MNKSFSKTKQPYLLLLIFFGLSFLAALFGTGRSYVRFTPDKAPDGFFNQINARDGWIEDGATLNPRFLFRRGNFIDLELGSWRPPGMAPAHLKIYLCGDLVSEVIVDRDKTERVYLTGSCEPRTVKFEVVNPFMPSEKDQRALGAQLAGVQVASKIGPALVKPAIILKYTLAIFTLSLMLYLVFAGTPWALLTILTPFISYFLLGSAIYVSSFKLYPLWTSIMALAAGAFVFKTTIIKFKQGSRSKVYFESEKEFCNFDLFSIAALIVMLLGGVLRFYDLDFGLPSNFHPDEVPKVNAVMRMVSQDTLNPQYFLHPSLLLYSTYFMNTLFHVFGMTGEFRDTAFLAGRTVSALAGTVSIYLTYIIGRRLFTKTEGLIASMLLAVFPLHVTCSRYLKEDALLTFFILAAVVAVLKAVQEDKRSFLLFAGLMAGFSAGVKYSGALSVMIIAGAPWLKSRSILPDRRYFFFAILALILVIAGFIISTPYSVLDSSKFLRDFNSERSHMLRGHTLQITAWSQYWMYHIKRSIMPGMTFLPTIAALAGLGVLLARRRLSDLYLVALFLLYYLPAEYVKAKPAPQPERYILPCLPFLAVAGAELLRILWQSRFRIVHPVLLILMLSLPAWRSVELASEIGNDTRDRMAAWMIDNIPHGSKIYLDWKPYEPRFFNNEFEVTYMPRANIFAKLHPDSLKDSGQEYLLLSSLWYDRYFSQPRSDKNVRERIKELFRTLPQVKTFKPRFGTYGFHNPTVTLFSLKELSINERTEESSLGNG